MTTRLYLAHASVDRKKILKIEKDIEKRTGLDLFNPFYAKSAERKDIEAIDRGEYSIWSSKRDYRSIVNGDIKAIDESEGVLAVITTIETCGAYMEMWYAKNEYKPVYVIFHIGRKQRKKLEDMKNHPWIKYCATQIFNSVDEFIDYAEEII